MDIERVLPELRQPMQRAQVNAPRWLIRAAVRMMRVPKNASVHVRTVKAGSVRLRVYEPAHTVPGPRAGLLWIHGGGLLFGDAKQDESLCLSTAERLGMVVVSANYRVAPEHPFPAAHNDVHTAWRWFHNHAHQLQVDPSRIAVGGESAGGGLAAGLAQRIHSDGGVQPIAQWLFAPMMDDRTAADRSLDDVQHFVWDNRKNHEGWSGYLGAEPGPLETPAYAVPGRRTELAGLPPAFITWADIELFANEDRAYATALQDSGVPVVTDIVEGGVHGFENWGKETPVAQALISRAQEWLRHSVSSPLSH